MTPISTNRLSLRTKPLDINVKLHRSLWDFSQPLPASSGFSIKILIACYKFQLKRRTSKCEQENFKVERENQK